jgi:hypothetical protein
MDASQPLEKMHGLLLEALRHRKQEIFNYLAILGPALAGFAWLLYADDQAANKPVGVGLFLFGTASALSLLFFGAVYSLMLGYNYRYITLQLAKIEYILNMKEAMLEGWPKLPQAFGRYKWCAIPVCTPPEIIKVFWAAFLAGLGGVMLTAWFWKPHHCSVYAVVLGVGIPYFVGGGILCPVYLGSKLNKLRLKESEELWKRIKESLETEPASN